MAQSKASPTKVKAAERRLQALNLRKAGASYAEIGRAMGFTEQRAHKVVSLELDRLNSERSEAAAAVAQLEAARLDALHLAYWKKAVEGDVDAANIVLKVAGRRAKLLGLDQPASVNINRLGALAPVIVEEVLSNAHTNGSAAAPVAADRGAGELPPV
jgi:hypothetical protein